MDHEWYAYHAQVLRPIDFQRLIHDATIFFGQHACCSHRMEERIRRLPHKLLQLFIALHLIRWIVSNGVRSLVSIRVHDIATELDDLDKEFKVKRVLKEGRVNDGRCKGVRGADVDGATGEGLQEAGHERIVMSIWLGFEVDTGEEAGSLENPAFSRREINTDVWRFKM